MNDDQPDASLPVAPPWYFVGWFAIAPIYAAGKLVLRLRHGLAEGKAILGAKAPHFFVQPGGLCIGSTSFHQSQLRWEQVPPTFFLLGTLACADSAGKASHLYPARGK